MSLMVYHSLPCNVIVYHVIPWYTIVYFHKGWTIRSCLRCDCREMEEGREEVESEEAVTATTDMDSVAVEESSVIREDPCVEIFQQNLMVK